MKLVQNAQKALAVVAFVSAVFAIGAVGTYFGNMRIDYELRTAVHAYYDADLLRVSYPRTAPRSERERTFDIPFRLANGEPLYLNTDQFRRRIVVLNCKREVVYIDPTELTTIINDLTVLGGYTRERFNAEHFCET